MGPVLRVRVGLSLVRSVVTVVMYIVVPEAVAALGIGDV